MLVAFIILLVLFLILSVLSFMGKLMVFIAGKNTENREETSYDRKGAGNFVGIIMMMLMISTCVGILGFALENMRWLILASPISFILLLIFAIIFINTNDRFVMEQNEKEEDKQ